MRVAPVSNSYRRLTIEFLALESLRVQIGIYAKLFQLRTARLRCGLVVCSRY